MKQYVPYKEGDGKYIGIILVFCGLVTWFTGEGIQPYIGISIITSGLIWCWPWLVNRYHQYIVKDYEPDKKDL